jgi:hypothetical protein
MTRHFTATIVAAGFVLSCTAAASAQSNKPASHYDPAAEVTVAGVVTGVESAAAVDGIVGVHLTLRTTEGRIVRVHLGPAMFIGMNDFFFLVDDLVAVKGASVSHAGDVGFWARLVTKGAKTLTLRSEDGTPRWPYATADDPDGCGVSHAPIRH